MNLNEVKTLLAGTIKAAFANKKTLDKFGESSGALLYNGQKVNNFPVFVADDAPVGNIIAFMGNNAPKDYLVCDGTIYNISDYPLLAQHMLDEFGKYNYFGGDGSTTFAVPDLRGEFLRGTGTGTRKTGTGADVGMHQDGTKHIYFTRYSNGNLITGNNTTINPTNLDTQIFSTNGKRTDNTGCSNVNANHQMYYTARPTNTSVLYCIKYQITQNNISKDMVNYSLEEQIIGSWIDGKPLYQKTIVTTSSNDGSTAKHNIGDLNIDFVVNIDGIFTNSLGTYCSISRYNSTEDYFMVQYYPTETSIWIATKASLNLNRPVYITLQYTKTTDVENSFTSDMLSSIKMNDIVTDDDVNDIIGGI